MTNHPILQTLMKMVNNTFVLEKFDSGMHYIMLDEEVVQTLIAHNNHRVMCRLNDQVEFHCAIMPKKESGYFINIGSSICKKLKIKEGSAVTASFSADHSKYQLEMPEELQEALNTDLEADQLFHSLTEGNQRGLIYLVTQVKSKDKRIERALKITEKLKIGVTSPRIILK